MFCTQSLRAAEIKSSQIFGVPVVGPIRYSSSGANAILVEYPVGIVSTDIVILIIGRKPLSVESGGVNSVAGWSSITNLFGGGYDTLIGTDQGNTEITLKIKDSVTGTESGLFSVGFTSSTTSIAWGVVIRIPSEGKDFNLQYFTGEDVSSGNVSTLLDSPIKLESGDVLIWTMCIPTDAPSFDNHAVLTDGLSLGGIELAEPKTSAGSDCGGFISYLLSEVNTENASITVSADTAGTSTNARGPLCLLHFR